MPETPCVVWTSALFNRTGYAEEARSNLLALDRAGVPILVAPRHWLEWEKRLRPSDTERLEQLVMLDPPERFIHVMHTAPRWFQRHPRAIAHVGRTMHETDTIPEEWVPYCNAMDEIWVPSEFNVETFARGGVRREKLRAVPECLQLELYDPGVPPLEIPNAKGFVFLSVFAWSRRKGWDLLVRAYVEEFAADEDVTLVLKVHPLFKTVGEALAELQAFLVGDLGRDPSRCPRILVLDSNPGAEGMPRLYRAADAFVLPSRGEGWGRPYMEAMAMGLPTIGTRWSGNLAYMTDGNSYLVDCAVVEVDETATREWPWFRGQRWAEPSVEHLRALMRRVCARREEARARAARARADIVAWCSLDRVGELMRARLEALGAESGTAPTVSTLTSGPQREGRTHAPTVAACVLARRGGSDLERCLSSIGGIADEVIVGYQGSLSIPRGALAPWRARDVRLKSEATTKARLELLGRTKADWVLLLDDDETLDEEGREDVRRLTPQRPAVAYLARRLSYTGARADAFVVSVEPRLLPNTSDARGAIEDVGDASQTLQPSAIVVHHHGWRPGRLDPTAAARDLEGLEGAADRRPGDAALAYEIGLLNHALGRASAAEHHLQKAAATYAEMPAEAWVFRRLANATSRCPLRMGPSRAGARRPATRMARCRRHPRCLRRTSSSDAPRRASASTRSRRAPTGSRSRRKRSSRRSCAPVPPAPWWVSPTWTLGGSGGARRSTD